MGMKKTSTLLLTVLAFWLATASVWGEQAALDPDQNSESWSEWVVNKLTQGLGLDKQDSAAKNWMDKDGDAASEARERMDSFGSRSKSQAQDAANYARDNWDQSIRMPTERAGNAAQETMAEAVEEGKHKVAGAYGDAKEKLITAKDFASDKAYGAKEATENMYKGARQKMNSASPTASDKAYDAKETTANMYGQAKERMNHASNVASDKAHDAKEVVKGAMGCGGDNAAGAYGDAKNTMERATSTLSDKASDAMEYGRERAADAYEGAKEKINLASDKAYDAKDRVAGGIEYGREKAANSYEEAKQRVAETYEEAKGYVSEHTAHTTHNYEAAKEKESQAAGDLRDKMRT